MWSNAMLRRMFSGVGSIAEISVDMLPAIIGLA
jgi:hypothetical protein